MRVNYSTIDEFLAFYLLDLLSLISTFKYKYARSVQKAKFYYATQEEIGLLEPF